VPKDAPASFKAFLNSAPSYDDLLKNLLDLNKKVQSGQRGLADMLHQEETSRRQGRLEEEHSAEVTDWMVDAKVCVWPEGLEQPEACRPALHGAPAPTMHHLTPAFCLPLPGPIDLSLKNLPSELKNLDDVAEIKALFELVSWCNLTMHCLRGPPSCAQLRVMTEAARFFPLAKHLVNEKLLKHFTALYTKFKAWRGKAVRFLTGFGPGKRTTIKRPLEAGEATESTILSGVTTTAIREVYQPGTGKPKKLDAVKVTPPPPPPLTLPYAATALLSHLHHHHLSPPPVHRTNERGAGDSRQQPTQDRFQGGPGRGAAIRPGLCRHADPGGARWGGR